MYIFVNIHVRDPHSTRFLCTPICLCQGFEIHHSCVWKWFWICCWGVMWMQLGSSNQGIRVLVSMRICVNFRCDTCLHLRPCISSLLVSAWMFVCVKMYVWGYAGVTVYCACVPHHVCVCRCACYKGSMFLHRAHFLCCVSGFVSVGGTCLTRRLCICAFYPSVQGLGR